MLNAAFILSIFKWNRVLIRYVMRYD